MSFGDILREVLQQKGIKTRDFAKAIGLHENTAYYYINGKLIMPDAANLNKMLEYLNLPPDFFNSKIPPYIKVGQRIKQYREIKGIAPDKVADCLGISVEKLSDIEEGKYNFSKVYLSKFETHLGACKNWLLTGEGTANARQYNQNELKNIKKIPVVGSLPSGTLISHCEMKFEEIDVASKYLSENREYYALKCLELPKPEQEQLRIFFSDYIVYTLPEHIENDDILLILNNVDNSISMKHLEMTVSKKTSYQRRQVWLIPEKPLIKALDVDFDGFLNLVPAGGRVVHAKIKPYEYFGRVVYQARIFRVAGQEASASQTDQKTPVSLDEKTTQPAQETRTPSDNKVAQENPIVQEVRTSQIEEVNRTTSESTSTTYEDIQRINKKYGIDEDNDEKKKETVTVKVIKE